MSADLKRLTELVSQVSDTYAQKCDIQRDDDWYVLKLQEELGELVAEHLRATGRGRMKGMSGEDVKTALANEAADVLAHLLLFAKARDIDLEQALARKWFSYLPEADV